jgi:flavodoxin I
MKALIVYDSFFGNTEQIARAIGNSLGPPEDVRIVRVGDVKPEQLAGLELLIVGSPTRGFRPTPAITDFLKSMPGNSLSGIKVTAFDTRIAPSDVESPVLRTIMKVGGYAATPIVDRLKKKGGDLITPPEGFFVTGEKGPLKEGELERAAEWARASIEVRKPR